MKYRIEYRMKRMENEIWKMAKCGYGIRKEEDGIWKQNDER